MTKYSEMHYQGFIDTCVAYGIEKEAADRLYKEAWLGAALRGIGTVARILGRGAVRGAQAGIRSGAISGKFLGRTRGAISGAFSGAKEHLTKVRNFAGTRAKMPGKAMGRGMTQAERAANLSAPTGGAPTGGAGGAPTGGAPTGGAPTGGAGGAPTGGAPIGGAPTGGAGGAPTGGAPTGGGAPKLTMMQRWGNFAQKHPKWALFSAAAPTVMLTSMANSHENNPQYGQAPTMTPWEQSMYNRMDNGYNLPGLGMDPSYFSGSRSYNMYGL